MAHSKSGGTRSYIRGKIGADVYSIGKDGKGKRQQVVRSLAEQVSNPQTEAQMKGRMIMSTVMQAVSALSPIIDHSFDNVPNGQPAISEFISRNYNLIKADVAAHPASGNSFGLNQYQEKGAKIGPWVIAKGDIQVPSSLGMAAASDQATLTITKSSNDDTAGEIRAKIGLPVGDYMTIVALSRSGKLNYCRLYVSNTLPDDTVVTQANVENLFIVESNADVTIVLDTTKIDIDLAGKGTAVADLVLDAGGLIVSQKVAGAWKHSNSTMINATGATKPASDSVLPTYPQGQARFLNGGDL